MATFPLKAAIDMVSKLVAAHSGSLAEATVLWSLHGVNALGLELDIQCPSVFHAVPAFPGFGRY